jgi:hypothetical protein
LDIASSPWERGWWCSRGNDGERARQLRAVLLGDLPACGERVGTRRCADVFEVAAGVDLEEFVTHVGYGEFQARGVVLRSEQSVSG